MIEPTLPPSSTDATPHNRFDAGTLHRLDALETDNRKLRRLSLALIGIVAVLTGLAVALMVVSARYGLPGTTADIVAARQFVLRDASGAQRGLWGTDDKGALRLTLQDAAGQPRLRLSLLDDGGAGVSLIDSAGHNRVVLALLADQAVSVVLADPNGSTRSVLGLSADGSSSLLFADRRGVARASLGVDAQGLGTFTLSDRGRTAAEEPAEPDTAVPDSAQQQ
jgi:hypothetical protein